MSMSPIPISIMLLLVSGQRGVKTIRNPKNHPNAPTPKTRDTFIASTPVNEVIDGCALGPVNNIRFLDRLRYHALIKVSIFAPHFFTNISLNSISKKNVL